MPGSPFAIIKISFCKASDGTISRLSFAAFSADGYEGLAKDIRAARARGEETGLSDEEIAFYDALAENDSARQVMGEPALRLIAHELVTVIKGNVSVDWMHRDSARANIRRHVKRLLRKYGYPPDLQDAAVQNVLQQAEALSAEWAA